MRSLQAGYIPLVDAAPLIAAAEMGFAEAEGLDLSLTRAPSWSALRDMLSFGQVAAAHMLAPVPVATALGIGGFATPLLAVSTLSVNGNVVGVSRAMAARLAAAGHGFDFADASAAGVALVAAAEGRLRIGVPFPFSMHAELLYFWLSAVGLPAPQSVDIRTVPPQMMDKAMAAGEIDAFCVGEPWGTIAVEAGTAELLLPTSAIWAFAPEKTLTVREDWAADHDDTLGRLIRAVWRAGRWLGRAESRTVAAELLARKSYLDMPPHLIDRALAGQIVTSPRGERRATPNFLQFHDGAATFPWRSQAAWIGVQMAARLGLDRTDAARSAAAVFRTDLHRRHLAETGADLPGASTKVEGTLCAARAVASTSGNLHLPPDRFFDGKIFDPTGIV